MTAPTAVIHGRDDRLLHWSAAVDIADAMPNSELHIYPGMGHFFPPALIPEFVQIVRRTADCAERQVSGFGS